MFLYSFTEPTAQTISPVKAWTTAQNNRAP